MPSVLAACIVAAGIAVPALNLTQSSSASAAEDATGTLKVALRTPLIENLFPGDEVPPIPFALSCQNSDGDTIAPDGGVPEILYTTDDGTAVTHSIPVGARCTLTPEVPQTCTLNPTSLDVVINSSEAPTLAPFTLACDNHWTLEVIDATTNHPLAGTTLKISSHNNTHPLTREVTSDENGIIDMGVVPGGMYDVTPVTIPSAYSQLSWTLLAYVSDLPQRPDTTTVAIDRRSTKLTVKVTTPSGRPLEGLPAGVHCEARESTLSATPERSYVDRGTWGMNQAAPSTNKAGIVFLDNNPAGTECTIEVTPPDDCVSEAARAHFSIPDVPKDTYSLDMVVDCENKGSLSFIKVDADSLEKPLKGAEFALKSTHNDLTLLAISDAKGQVSFTDVPWGDYTLTETKASPGYLNDAEPRQITVDAQHQHYQLAGVTNTRKPYVPPTVPTPPPSTPPQLPPPPTVVIPPAPTPQPEPNQPQSDPHPTPRKGKTLPSTGASGTLAGMSVALLAVGVTAALRRRSR